MLFFLTLISMLNSVCTDTQTLSNLMQYMSCTLEGIFREMESFPSLFDYGKEWGSVGRALCSSEHSSGSGSNYWKVSVFSGLAPQVCPPPSKVLKHVQNF